MTVAAREAHVTAARLAGANPSAMLEAGYTVKTGPVSPYSGMPEWIAPDDFAGRWVLAGPLKDTHRVELWTAGELAGFAPESAVYTSFGTLQSGREGFARERYLADRFGNLHVYASNGQKVIVHPSDRQLRIVCRKPAAKAA